MKKLIAAVGVFGVFILYSLGVRHELPTVGKPSALAAANANATTNNTPAGTSGSTNTATNGSPSSSTTGSYKDGTYTGSIADAYYGNVQVSATIAGGKITDVSFLQYPDTHSDSVMINQQAMPYLKQEAVQAQSANVQIISGATFTSQAFVQSLTDALNRAKA